MTVSENVVIPWSVHVQCMFSACSVRGQCMRGQSFISVTRIGSKLIEVCLLIRILKSPGSLVFCGNNTGSIKDDPYWTSRDNSLELIKLSSISKVSLV